MMDKLKALLDRCKCGVHLTVNQHRDCYLSVEAALEDFDAWECPRDFTPEVRAGMIAADTIIDLHFYPDTPIGSYHILHFDLDAALDIALECLAARSVQGDR